MIVKNLTKKGFFNNISFSIREGDKVAVLSNNALATTMLFDVLSGKEEADSGTVHWGKTIKYGYLPQNNNPYFEGNTNSIVDWLRQYSKDQTEMYIRSWLGRMLFSGEEALKPVNVLSGGERVRCMFAKLMLESPNFLLMDEPTNHLDLESITALNKGMINYKGCMLFASHDQEIVETTANRIFDLIDENTFKDLQTVNFDD